MFLKDGFFLSSVGINPFSDYNLQFAFKISTCTSENPGQGCSRSIQQSFVFQYNSIDISTRSGECNNRKVVRISKLQKTIV